MTPLCHGDGIRGEIRVSHQSPNGLEGRRRTGDGLQAVDAIFGYYGGIGKHTFSGLKRPTANASPVSFPVEGVIKVRREKPEGEPLWGTSARGGGSSTTGSRFPMPPLRRRCHQKDFAVSPNMGLDD